MQLKVMSYTLFVVCCCIVSSYALTTDLFEEARQTAYDGNYDKALVLIDSLLENDSGNTDVLLLKGMVYLFLTCWRYSRCFHSQVSSWFRRGISMATGKLVNM